MPSISSKRNLLHPRNKSSTRKLLKPVNASFLVRRENLEKIVANSKKPNAFINFGSNMFSALAEVEKEIKKNKLTGRFKKTHKNLTLPVIVEHTTKSGRITKKPVHYFGKITKK
jgi:hypothetical protein